MKITFLGTAAAEGLPAVFCNCETCRRAKARGGKEVRTRSQILIDDDTLFDFPMDTYMHMLMYKLDLSAVKRVLITHAHMDHCYPQEFCMRGAPFAHGMTRSSVNVFCNSTVRDIFIGDTSREIRPEIAESIAVNVLHPYDKATDGDMTIIALPASHTKGEECLVYYLERGGKGVLLLNDTGVLDGDVYRRLAGLGCKVNFAAMDCTYGAIRHGKGRHMGLYDVADQTEVIEKSGLFARDAIVYATHFSHNTDLDFDGMVKAAEPYGIKIAYDGCVVNV
ncbi:MAG: MBL fold metallo-hydrolase [Roseburia sp.]|nr:MBL fold metallo-hydrolase [Roseburia sp.]